MSPRTFTCRAALDGPSSSSAASLQSPPRARTPGRILSPDEGAPLPSSPEAAEVLYAQLAPLVRRLIRQYGKTPEMRQDLSGELYCRFCALLQGYDPARGVPLRPYLIRQLTAAAYAYARQQWRLEKRLLPLPSEAETFPALATEDPTPAWIQTLSDAELFAGLPQALAGLPRRQRQVVILRYYEEYTFEEIGAALGVQASTARSLLRHGLNKLRTSLSSSLNTSLSISNVS
jgi:RNA polymerase sigma factor (sigma-70 family)